MRDEIDHPSRPTGLRRFPVAFSRLLNPTGELQEALSFIEDKERESSASTDNQTEDKCAHKVPPLRVVRIIFKFPQLDLILLVSLRALAAANPNLALFQSEGVAHDPFPSPILGEGSA